MVEVIEMAASTTDKIREQANALDFETGFDPDERLSREERAEGIAEERNVTRELAEDQHLAYRAAAAYFAEKASDADNFVMSAMGLVIDHKTRHGDLLMLDLGFCVVDGNIQAKVGRKGKMPIVTLTMEPAPLVGTAKRFERETLAKYRYNPKSDKLSRIG